MGDRFKTKKGEKKRERKLVQILKNMDMCHNSKYSLSQNSALGERERCVGLWERKKRIC
jgi:hypothetical protein